MNTEKIFHDDAYCREITAPIIGREKRGGNWRLRLARTIFRPEGGGQPADAGTVNGLPLLALEEEGDEIVHVLGDDPGAGAALLKLDFERRFDHMQQHSAQHLLSQVLVRLLDAPTLSFAIGPEHASIEIGRPEIGAEEIRALERECARLTFSALPLRVFESDDPSSLNLRKPPKKRGRIRVVEIAGFDQSACGGTHVKNSAEIGPLKIVGTERVRANVRLYYAAGYRAIRDHQRKHDILQQLQRRITQPLDEMAAHVEALLDERDGLRRELKKARRRELEREIEAAAAVDPAGGLIVREFSGFDAVDLRFFATSLMKRDRQVLVFQRTGPAYAAIGRGRGDFDLRAIAPRLFAMLDGRGGGSANLIEGRPGDFSAIGAVAELLRQSLDCPAARLENPGQ